jgi:adenylate cyclase
MKFRISSKSLLAYSPQIITGLWMIAIMVVWYWQLFGIGKWELASYNMRFHWRGEISPDPRIVLIAIDEASIFEDGLDEEDLRENPEYALLRNYPYPRKAWALIIEKLAKAGARAIVFDILFTKESPLGTEVERRKDDTALKQALIKYQDKVAIGANFTLNETGSGGEKTWQLMKPNPELLPSDLVPDRKIVGYVNYMQDGDGFIRRMDPVRWPFSMHLDIPYSLDALAVKKAFPKTRLPPPYEPRLIQFAGFAGVYNPYPLHLLFMKKAWEPERQLKGGTLFKDKIVLVGPRANHFQDIHLTPFGDGNPSKMYGVDIHANAMATLLSNRILRELGQVTGLFIVALVGIALIFIIPIAKSPAAKLVPTLGLGALYCITAQLAFSRADLFIPFAPVLVLVVGSTASVVTIQAIVERMEKQRARGFLTRYVSRNVAEELLSRGEDVDAMLKPQRRFVTILMSDVRNFTTMTESSEPEPFVHQLNEYLTEMVECVFKYGGTLDKFVGDAVMAVFGSPTSHGRAEDALAAVKTAAEMRQRLAQLHVKWEKEGRPIFRFGIGVNAGEVMAGDIGSSQKAEFGVIGDAVNLAARVESATKEQKTDILITDSIYNLVESHVEAELRGDIKVKGREQAVRIYALKALKS